MRDGQKCEIIAIVTVMDSKHHDCTTGTKWLVTSLVRWKIVWEL